jgi:predicted enzyme related to lactoylglutathione lyase
MNRVARLMLFGGLLLCLTLPASAEESTVACAAPVNPVVFWELATHDGPRSLEFFKTVFGWASSPVPGAKTFFHILDSGNEGGSIDGGVFTLTEAKPAFVAVYVLVDDIEARAELVTKAGGLILEPPHEISPGTWICLFNEPSGVTFAMLEKRPTE